MFFYGKILARKPGANYPKPSLKRSLRAQMLLFMAARMVLATTIRMVYPFLTYFGRGLGLDLIAISQALTIRSVSGVFGPFIALVGDSRGRKTGMALGLSLFVMGVAFMTFRSSYPIFIVMLAMTLLGNFVYVPSMQAYLGDRVSYQRRGRVVGIVEFGWAFGFILGVPLVGFLIARFGWQAPFPFMTVAGLLVLATLIVLLPKDQKSSGDAVLIWDYLRKVFSFRPAVACIILGVVIALANEMVNVVFGVWMEEDFGVKIAALSVTAMVIGFSELGAEALVSGFSDRIGKVRSVRIGLVCSVLAALALPWLGSNLPGALLGLVGIYITFEFTIVSSIPLISEILPDARATLLAVYIAALSLGRSMGDLLAPRLYLFGKMLEGLPTILIVALVSVVLNLSALIVLKVVESRGLR